MIAFNEEQPAGGLEETVSEVFSNSGLLSRSPDFEYRREQQAMAEATAAALEGGDSLVVEAGTGVGKSLAYLIPAALHARDRRRKAIISTHTINLQEQLVRKDLPIVRSLFDRAGSAVLLKGRGNYVCPTRLEAAMSTAGDLFTTSETDELRALWEWCQTTKDGTLSDLGFTPMPKVWSQVCSESHACTVKRCGPTGRCFYQEVKKRAAEADVLVMNHMLFFTLLSQVDAFGEGESGFLYPGDFAIFDEAHTLENIAAKQLGLSLSQVGLRFDLQRLYNPKTKKGLFQVARNPEGVREVAGLMDSLQAFFDEVEEGCEFPARGGEYRVRSQEIVENTVAGALFRVQTIAAEAAEKSDRESIRSELGEMASSV